MSARLEDADFDGYRILERQKHAHLQDLMPSYPVRRDRLDRFRAMIERHADAIVRAASEDFGHRARQETEMVDITITIVAIKHARRHLRRWMKARRVPTTLHNRPGYNRILRQPLGTVGVIGAWNYPLYTVTGPAIDALAAGNRVMIKPSDLAPRSSELLQRIVAEFFSEDEMAVVTGGIDVAKAFIELPFDHIIYTGSGAVGRQVAQAAAKNLVPVTLELGGKSPVLLDDSCNMSLAAGRVMRAKLLNAGQTCVAPDYLMVSHARLDEAVKCLAAAVEQLYPKSIESPDYTSIVNDRHFARLQGLLDDARAKGARIVSLGGAVEHDAANRRMVPTLVLDVTEEMKIMREEIFGPLLPVMAYRRVEDALHYINCHDRPLALYWFGEKRANRDQVLRGTISGGVTVNDCVWHVAQEGQPFGGVGPSGSGAYHGENGFRTFSKEKPVFFQSRVTGSSLLNPPYGKTFDFMMRVLKRVA